MTKFKALIASFIVAILFFNTACTAAPAPSQARQIIDKMVNAIGKHTGVTFTMDAAERLISKPSEYNQIEIFTKINVSPLKIYGKVMKDPNKGTELLYVTGQRDNKIRVNPGKFLPTMTLAPTSGLLTKNQHHTLLTSGFMIVNKIVTDGIKRADARGKFDEVFKYAGDVQYKNRNCYKIVIDDPTFGYTTAVGQKGETVMGLAKRLLVSEYHIMELNPGSRGLDDDISGKTIKVPTSYAKKTILYIDKENNFPIYQEMSDDKGVFEKYEYSNLVVNPAFKADEFSEKFSEYKF
jgi:outer membrane lipoprotein-sorting protein